MPNELDRRYDEELAKVTGVNLNNVANNTIFTTPGSGFTRCVVTFIIISNVSGTPSTNAASYGASGTPADWHAGSGINGGLTTTSKISMLLPGAADNAVSTSYGTGVTFVVAVTVGGAAITGDFSAWGYYE